MRLFEDNLSKEKIERIQSWIKALRSGKYQQGTGVLREANTYCCLGVACNLLNPNGWNRDLDTPRFTVIREGEAVFASAVMPREGMEYFGLRDSCGEFMDAEGTLIALTELNDSESSFDEIADIIEEELRLALLNQE